MIACDDGSYYLGLFEFPNGKRCYLSVTTYGDPIACFGAAEKDGLYICKGGLFEKSDGKWSQAEPPSEFLDADYMVHRAILNQSQFIPGKPIMQGIEEEKAK